jgi:hypothetical protein
MMKEKPILFSTPMVRAILDGRKTMTRRVVKGGHGNPAINDFAQGIIMGMSSPYFVGDILWVQETWVKTPNSRCLYRGNYHNGGADDIPANTIIYRADYDDREPTVPALKWKPSIFMPREACRLRLRVTGVRVERLQGITEEDARREGVDLHCKIMDCDDYAPTDAHVCKTIGLCYQQAFATLWDNLDDKRGYDWDSNPYVFVVEFERLTEGKQ